MNRQRTAKALAGRAMAALFCLAGLATLGDVEGSAQSGGSGAVDFGRDVQPLLQASCTRCHGSEGKAKGQLRLDVRALAFKGGVSGMVIVPGNARESRLYQVLVSDDKDERMPLKTPPLARDKIELIRRWIDEGAAWPDAVAVEAKVETHWAFVKPAAPTPPASVGAGNPIDAFIAAAHREHSLTPAPPAPKNLLLRRVTFDLIGLPPTPQELHAFLADDSPEAYERAVDRLLSRPQYGERWGRHWMDVWRYADWSGENTNLVRSSPLHMWRWRDWIIESLNQDKAYDRMIVEMLAGDEVAPDDPGTLRATAFLARNWYPFNRNVWLEDTVEHTAKAFLALTFDCARCHDHKYDPISQKDYYRLRAFFEPHDVRTDAVPGTDPKADGLVRVFDARPAAPTYLFRRGDDTRPDLENPLSPQMPAILGGSLSIQPVAASTGRRLALARWIVDERNPLTARVAVNHIWTRHFGAPLVGSVTDFGVRTPRPALGDLLDWLSVRFMSDGWSMKKLHRLLVTSTAYRMKSGGFTPAPGNLSADPDNRLLWRMNASRLEAEAVRDALLHVAGSLDPAMGGKEIPFQDGETNWRRSVYFRHGNERQMKFLLPFDAADVTDCYRRATTVIPQQALALLNSVLVQDQARVLAGRLRREGGSEEEFIRRAFERVLSRPPSPEEAGRCGSFLEVMSGLFSHPEALTYESKVAPGRVAASKDPRQRARENLIHVLMNQNDFITIR